MANDQPSPTPAPNGAAPQTPPSEPAPKQAEVTPSSEPTTTPPAPTNPVDQLTEEEKGYLKGQGLTDDDLKSPDAIRKIINHGRSSQKALSELKSKVDGLSGSATPPGNPLVTPPAPSEPQPSSPTGEQPIDDITAFNLATSLSINFPELKEDLGSGKFYKDMQANGIPLRVDNKVNLAGIQSYAGLIQKQKQLEAKIEENSKPGDGVIPDAEPQVPPQPAADAPMTLPLARAIALSSSKGAAHPRLEEAKKFVQDNTLGK